MSSSDLLVDAFGRIRETVAEAVEGLSTEELAFRVDGSGNSIAWLVWHLTRIQDDHIADAAGLEQVWTGQGWARRFGLPLADADTGYGHTSAQVASVGASAEQLTGYHDAVHAQTVGYLAGLDGKALARVVDTSWNPPVTLAVRLISVVSDDLQHAGQAAFVRGVLSRR
ncbi:mycothiol transferase [Streptomyces melanogenes]|uniref:mycothiol transferase n=1 Tax=Streptomyces melanogenes TaxID=67326 RepID=UPI0037A5FD49